MSNNFRYQNYFGNLYKILLEVIDFDRENSCGNRFQPQVTSMRQALFLHITTLSIQIGVMKMSFHYAYAKSKSQANSLITNRLSAVSENRLPSRDMKAFPLFREKIFIGALVLGSL